MTSQARTTASDEPGRRGEAPPPRRQPSVGTQKRRSANPDLSVSRASVGGGHAATFRPQSLVQSWLVELCSRGGDLRPPSTVHPAAGSPGQCVRRLVLAPAGDCSPACTAAQATRPAACPAAQSTRPSTGGCLPVTHGIPAACERPPELNGVITYQQWYVENVGVWV